jgi:NADH-quinone oxidoreductase subunit L
MVTAGVILMVKMFPLLELSQISLIIITIIGSITAMLMGAIGIAQFDIKKIVAYSTCSQLGLMFVAIGTGVPSIAIFHLLTHAFFKALLFLGAGSVIHGMHGEQDLRNMGGLLKKMPFTFVCILIGSLALCGVYPLAGYYSKDAIFESMYAVTFLKNNDFSTLYLMSFWFTLIAVLFSGIYSFKIIWYAFFGRLKYVEAHESGFIMLLPMIILALLSCVGGYIGFAYIGFGAENNITHSLFGAFELMHLVPDNIKNIPTFLGIGGIIISYLLYALKNNKFIAKILLTISYPFRNTLFFNQAYDVSLGKLINLMNILINIIEKRFINKFIGASVEFCKILGLLFNSLQTGRYYHYLGVSLFGIIIILMFVIWGHY